jgi:hypothetical protein
MHTSCAIVQTVGEKRSRGRVPVFAAVVAALALFVAHLLDCLPGFGTGGDPGSGEPVSAEPEPEAERPRDEAAVPDARPTVVVRGAQCQLETAPPDACAAVCDRLKAEADASQGVDVDATHGSHGAVEELVRCLSEAGFSNVDVRSE